VDGNLRIYAADIGNDSEVPTFAESSLDSGSLSDRDFSSPGASGAAPDEYARSLLLSRLATVTYPTTIAEALC
jgi:hypothetical protein